MSQHVNQSHSMDDDGKATNAKGTSNRADEVQSATTANQGNDADDAQNDHADDAQKSNKKSNNMNSDHASDAASQAETVDANERSANVVEEVAEAAEAGKDDDRDCENASHDEGISDAGAELKKAKEANLRMYADIENMRRQHQQQLMRQQKFGNEKIIREMLGVVDSLEMAVLALVQGEISQQSLIEGVQLTLQMLIQTLEKFGVKAIEPEGGAFDPNEHEAIAIEESENVAANIVLRVIQKGYKLEERLLRPARVVVSKKPS